LVKSAIYEAPHYAVSPFCYLLTKMVKADRRLQK